MAEEKSSGDTPTKKLTEVLDHRGELSVDPRDIGLQVGNEPDGTVELDRLASSKLRLALRWDAPVQQNCFGKFLQKNCKRGPLTVDRNRVSAVGEQWHLGLPTTVAPLKWHPAVHPPVRSHLSRAHACTCVARTSHIALLPPLTPSLACSLAASRDRRRLLRRPT